MSQESNNVVRFLYFGAFSRLFLANFVLLIRDGDIVWQSEVMLHMFHACNMLFDRKPLRRGEIQLMPREDSLLGGEVRSRSSQDYMRLHRTCASSVKRRP